MSSLSAVGVWQRADGRGFGNPCGRWWIHPINLSEHDAGHGKLFYVLLNVPRWSRSAIHHWIVKWWLNSESGCGLKRLLSNLRLGLLYQHLLWWTEFEVNWVLVSCQENQMAYVPEHSWNGQTTCTSNYFRRNAVSIVTVLCCVTCKWGFDSPQRQSFYSFQNCLYPL
jgi:hypothetical protein